jgi:hypothetical protein
VSIDTCIGARRIDLGFQGVKRKKSRGWFEIRARWKQLIRLWKFFECQKKKPKIQVGGGTNPALAHSPMRTAGVSP